MLTRFKLRESSAPVILQETTELVSRNSEKWWKEEKIKLLTLQFRQTAKLTFKNILKLFYESYFSCLKSLCDQSEKKTTSIEKKYLYEDIRGHSCMTSHKFGKYLRDVIHEWPLK